MKSQTLIAMAASLLLIGCDTRQPQPKAETKPAATQRFVPTGTDPEVALDTQTGRLCRTIQTHSGDPLGILDPNCGVTAEQKQLQFVPKDCKGPTWVRETTSKESTGKYGTLPVCGEDLEKKQ